MDKAIEPTPEIKCSHRIFHLFPKDEIVKEKPQADLIHQCDELQVFQDQRGLTRYFLPLREDVGKAQESPDDFERYLVETEPDRPQEPPPEETEERQDDTTDLGVRDEPFNIPF